MAVGEQPNFLVIWGDDIGITNLSAYSDGLMGYRTPNIDRIAEGRPILAAGNSAGDREMLEDAHTGERPSLCLVVDHDDAEREYAYAGSAVTDPDAESILASADRMCWTVVSMRRDWNRIFPG